MLRLSIDGRRASVSWTDKGLTYNLGAVFLGPEWESDFRIVVPADHPVLMPGRPLIWKGFCDDPRVWALASEFARRCQSDDFEPGPLEVPA